VLQPDRRPPAAASPHYAITTMLCTWLVCAGCHCDGGECRHWLCHSQEASRAWGTCGAGLQEQGAGAAGSHGEACWGGGAQQEGGKGGSSPAVSFPEGCVAGQWQCEVCCSRNVGPTSSLSCCACTCQHTARC
jgi:hypothetical protein